MGISRIFNCEICNNELNFDFFIKNNEESIYEVETCQNCIFKSLQSNAINLFKKGFNKAFNQRNER